MLVKLDAIGAGRLFSKNLSSDDAEVVAENTAVEDTAIKTNSVIIKNRVLFMFIFLPVELVFAVLRIRNIFIFLSLNYFSIFSAASFS